MIKASICKGCGKPLPPDRKTYCNHSCRSAGMRQPFEKQCKVCGKLFPTVRSSIRVTCSAGCNSINRRRIANSGIAQKASDKAREVNPSLPHLGRFETHIHAKEWVIRSPDGTVYHCRNLMHWLREHADMLPGTPRQAWVGLANIKLSMQGRIKRTARTWKGWTVIDWGE